MSYTFTYVYPTMRLVVSLRNESGLIYRDKIHGRGTTTRDVYKKGAGPGHIIQEVIIIRSGAML